MPTMGHPLLLKIGNFKMPQGLDPNWACNAVGQDALANGFSSTKISMGKAFWHMKMCWGGHKHTSSCAVGLNRRGGGLQDFKMLIGCLDTSSGNQTPTGSGGTPAGQFLGNPHPQTVDIGHGIPNTMSSAGNDIELGTLCGNALAFGKTS